MGVIPTKIHGVLDYAVGLLLLLAPYLFGFADGGVAQWLPMLLGAGVIGYSLMTAYELGVASIISVPAHLGLDIAGGVLLAVSPWLFGFADAIFWPHLVVGVVEIGTAAMTERHAGRGESGRV